jgi:hypothetical protein
LNLPDFLQFIEELRFRLGVGYLMSVKSRLFQVRQLASVPSTEQVREPLGSAEDSLEEPLRIGRAVKEQSISD